MNISKITKLILITTAILVGLIWAIFYIKQQEFKKQLLFWEQISQIQPNYPDSWAKIAILNNNLGQKQKAKAAIEKARKLDPIREDLREIESKIKL